jgi:hypothetical protein
MTATIHAEPQDIGMNQFDQVFKLFSSTTGTQEDGKL